MQTFMEESGLKPQIPTAVPVCGSGHDFITPSHAGTQRDPPLTSDAQTKPSGHGISGSPGSGGGHIGSVPSPVVASVVDVEGSVDPSLSIAPDEASPVPSVNPVVDVVVVESVGFIDDPDDPAVDVVVSAPVLVVGGTEVDEVVPAPVVLVESVPASVALVESDPFGAPMQASRQTREAKARVITECVFMCFLRRWRNPGSHWITSSESATEEM